MLMLIVFYDFIGLYVKLSVRLRSNQRPPSGALPKQGRNPILTQKKLLSQVQAEQML